ncbi:MAG: acyltransferase [Caulobacteraceae bacterium]|nr:acyltransferase [Caulobacteraceae bacterium]
MAAAATARPGYNVAVGYLRAFSRLLVFALHAVVAYYPGPYPLHGDAARISMPVMDVRHFAGARILVAFNEISLMSLLFFLSGLFLWSSLSRKGAIGFFRERLVRLGLPFLVCGGVVAAIAYYPAYLQATPDHPSLAGYAQTWLTPAHWTTGPAWFLLILFIYDLIAIGLYLAAPGWGQRLALVAAGARERPLRFFLVTVAISAVAYLPLAMLLGPYDWWHWSIFWLQKCRVLEYAAFFFLGAAVGAFGLSRGLLAPDGALARRWGWWGAAAIVVFLIAANVLRKTTTHGLDYHPLWGNIANIGWVICCAVCAFALMAVFVRFAKRTPLLDNFANNSYGMYIVHYMFVTWTQYALLGAAISPIAKWLCVLAVTVTGSWALAAALRRIPAVGRNI